MTSIFLNAYQNVAFFDEQSLPKIDHSLGRRMTPLQRATLSASRSLFEKHGDEVKSFFADRRNLVVFATSFGEVSANYSVVSDIARKQFPVSPKDFQHSVYNAALGYLAIVERVDLHMMAVIDGFLSLDRALQLAVLQIKSGTPNVMVLCADENMASERTLARAEAFILSDRVAKGALELCDISFGRGELAAVHGPVFQNVQTANHPYCFLDPQEGAYTRISVANTGEWVASLWRSTCKP